MTNKWDKQSQKVLDRIAKVLDSPHKTGECPARGMFGRPCNNCMFRCKSCKKYGLLDDHDLCERCR